MNKILFFVDISYMNFSKMPENELAKVHKIQRNATETGVSTQTTPKNADRKPARVSQFVAKIG